MQTPRANARGSQPGTCWQTRRRGGGRSGLVTSEDASSLQRVSRSETVNHGSLPSTAASGREDDGPSLAPPNQAPMSYRPGTGKRRRSTPASRSLQTRVPERGPPLLRGPERPAQGRPAVALELW